MHRSILTGIFVFGLSAGTIGIATAAEAVSPVSPIASVGVRPDPAAYSGPTDTSDGPVPITQANFVQRDIPPLVLPAFVKAVKPSTPLRRFANGIVNRSSAIASSLTRSAMRFIGVPYVFGGTRTTGFDCSGYVQHVFRMHGMALPRTADAQFDAARHIRAKIVPGDLVFFHTYAAGVSHVGIYLGNNKFIHASSSRGVAISSLHDRYWAPRYLGAKRVVGS